MFCLLLTIGSIGNQCLSVPRRQLVWLPLFVAVAYAMDMTIRAIDANPRGHATILRIAADKFEFLLGNIIALRSRRAGRWQTNSVRQLLTSRFQSGIPCCSFVLVQAYCGWRSGFQLVSQSNAGKQIYECHFYPAIHPFIFHLVVIAPDKEVGEKERKKINRKRVCAPFSRLEVFRSTAAVVSKIGFLRISAVSLRRKPTQAPNFGIKECQFPSAAKRTGNISRDLYRIFGVCV